MMPMMPMMNPMAMMQMQMMMGEGMEAEKKEKKAWKDWSNDPDWEDWSKPVCKMIDIPKESTIVQAGLPQNAPAIHYYKGFDIFSSAAHILGEIVGDITTMVKIEHDTDLKQFPDVAKALTAAGGDATS